MHSLKIPQVARMSRCLSVSFKPICHHNAPYSSGDTNTVVVNLYKCIHAASMAAAVYMRKLDKTIQ